MKSYASKEETNFSHFDFEEIVWGIKVPSVTVDFEELLLEFIELILNSLYRAFLGRTVSIVLHMVGATFNEPEREKVNKTWAW